MVNDHFPYVYENGHWISTAESDRRERLLQAGAIAAKAGLGLICGWLFFAVWFCV
jgi:hypothetical protein